MLTVDVLEDAARKLEAYILNEGYEGYDPYDALNSPFLGRLGGGKLIRFSAQQLLKRSPVNLRPMLRIQKGHNPVTMGLCVQSFTYLRDVHSHQKEHYQQQIELSLDHLRRLRSKGYSGACWGYDFDWEARYASIPAFTPTIVATGFVTNALFENYKMTGDQASLDLCLSATAFVLKDLSRSYEGDSFCYSYSPRDHQMVFNATMKGARLLAQVYSVTKEVKLAEEAKKTVQFVIQHQKEEGSWPYSYADARTWVDSFHTGYVLDCLDEYMKLTNDSDYGEPLRRAVEFYVRNLFTDDGIPKYYSNKLYPIDSTAAAQAILTLTRFGYIEQASKVAHWMIEHMQDRSGYFYYQKTRFYTNKIPYMRWSNAPMLLALSYLLRAQNALV